LMSKTLFTKEKKREKVIILLTDWDANTWVDPILASLSAKKENIKIYTIWIWSKKWWYISYKVWPFIQKQKVAPLNEKTLKKIAQNTGWIYFRADNNYNFKKIFEYLKKLEKNDIEVEVKKEYKEFYNYFIYSLVFLLTIFSYLIFNTIETKKTYLLKK
jgi:Ca-activated chloride channel family protein